MPSKVSDPDGVLERIEALLQRAASAIEEAEVIAGLETRHGSRLQRKAYDLITAFYQDMQV